MMQQRSGLVADIYTWQSPVQNTTQRNATHLAGRLLEVFCRQYSTGLVGDRISLRCHGGRQRSLGRHCLLLIVGRSASQRRENTLSNGMESNRCVVERNSALNVLHRHRIYGNENYYCHRQVKQSMPIVASVFCSSCCRGKEVWYAALFRMLLPNRVLLVLLLLSTELRSCLVFTYY